MNRINATTLMTAPTPRTQAIDPALDEAFACLAATLCEIFQLPCDQMLRKLNTEFAANPLTAGFQLHLGRYPVGNA